MKYIPFDSLKQTSVLGLGTWQTIGQNLGFKESETLIREAYELGINFFDTSDNYGEGKGEQYLGKNLKSYPRESYILATKCFFPTKSKPGSQGLGKKHIMLSADLSLKNFSTDYIDLFQCHRFDPDTRLEETIEAMHSLVEKGKIRHWGVCRFEADQIIKTLEICKKNGWHKPISNQYFYSLLHREIEEELMPVCSENNIRIIAYSPLAQGVLTGKYNRLVPASSRGADKEQAKTMWDLNDQSLKRVSGFADIATEYKISLTELALRFCLHRPEIAVVLCGAAKKEQLKENCKAIDFARDIEFWNEIFSL